MENLNRSNVVFCSSHVKLNLEKSKTDIYREGKEVNISRTGLITCPVAILDRYLKMTDISDTSSEYIFRWAYYFKSSGRYNLKKSGPISYTRARELLLSVLESIGLEKHHFGLHSLRSGGTTAAEAVGVEDRLNKKHARWKSKKAKNDYIKEGLNQKLSVTRKLGI